MKAYKVYDEEWNDIFGKSQLCDFVTEWVCDHEDYYLAENIDELEFKPEQIQKIVKLVEEVVNGEYVKTVRQAKLLLSVCNFDVEELELN